MTRFGATHTVAGGDSAIADVQALTDGVGPDVVFEVVGLAALQQQAYDMTRPGGRVIMVGVGSMDTQTSFNTLFLTFTEKVIKGCFYGSSRPAVDFPRLADFYLRGVLKLDQMITHTYRLDEINEAFNALGRGDNARGLITPTA